MASHDVAPRYLLGLGVADRWVDGFEEAAESVRELIASPSPETERNNNKPNARARDAARRGGGVFLFGSSR